MATSAINVSSGERVVVYGNRDTTNGIFSSFVLHLSEQVKPNGAVVVLQHDDTHHDDVKEGTVDVCCVLYDPSLSEVLEKCLHMLRLAGTVHVLYTHSEAAEDRILHQLKSTLRLSGFIAAVTQVICEGEKKTYHATAKKPGYELGASVPLQLSTGTTKKDSSQQQVWTLSLDDAVDSEVMDSDVVLDDNDFKKPDPASLRGACGDASTKRKACKNCTCGLAEELKQERDTVGGRVTLDNIDSEIKASSCGNCYLGDAFRCAGCPYLGMPAFKPGERVVLTDSKLQPDL